MSRFPLAYAVADISALARTLKSELSDRDHQPGHVELLNMLARAAGWRNFQHFRAQADARIRLDTPPPPAAEPADLRRVQRTSRHFDADGALVRWPGKFSERQLCLWVLWSALPARRDLTEKQINAAVTARHRFGDHALLRRHLVDGGWLRRTPDGAVYRRIERVPTADALALIRHLGRR